MVMRRRDLMPTNPTFHIAEPTFANSWPEAQALHVRPALRGIGTEPVSKDNYDSGPMTMTDEDLIEEAGRRLMAAAPDADIILFGSRARGDARPDSDLDLLVIEPNFARRGEEYGRLRKELRGLEVAVDLVIYRRREAEDSAKVPGSFLHRALGEGRVLAGA